MKLRVASFNVENLFGRTKVFNFQDHSVGDQILKKIDKFRKLLDNKKYSKKNKKEIVRLYKEELKPYIEVREDRGKLFKRRGWAVTGVKAYGGAGDWDGAIKFKPAKFSKIGRGNTAQVIKDVRADVACIVEAENRPTLKSFDAHLLSSRYKYEMLIDANDPRGIDVGLYSKYPLGGVWTHMFDKDGNKTIFSRDCLEVEVFLSNDQPLYVLCNHFKSRGYDYDGTANEKRKRQAKRVAKILSEYDLTSDWVVVAGDFNDNPTSAPLQPLLNVHNMYDVLELQFPVNPMKRWTYHYDKFEQIDFILVSKPLKDRFRKAGVERRGMHNLKKLTTSSNGLVDVEEEYNAVTHWANAASDHGAVWAEFDV
ncbi:MAG: endonuclease/exonuclease/phosphatase family protein [Candidatus Aminicenantes bacterium]|nr:MAG: endonuclease/exonuclease/phosphatase family protein [Candidatus Aminicenantes bacterium]